MKVVSDIKWSPIEYEKAAVIAAEAGKEALSRLDWMTLEPQVIVDAGCGTGELSRHLQAKYPAARIYSVDSHPEMVAYANNNGVPAISVDAGTLPLDDSSVDMVFANLLLPYLSDVQAMKKLLREWRRVLRPEGLLMFTALGVDTLQQLRGIIKPTQAPLLFDMHDCGDMLVEIGFADPILDVDYYTLSYEKSEKLWHELQASGMLHDEVDPSDKALLKAGEDGCYDITYEVIHAHAFAPQPIAGYKQGEDGVTRIPLSHLRRQKG